MNKWEKFLCGIIVAGVIITGFSIMESNCFSAASSCAANIAAFAQQYYLVTIVCYLTVYIFAVFLGQPVVGPLTILGSTLFSIPETIGFSLSAIFIGSAFYIRTVRHFKQYFLSENIRNQIDILEKRTSFYRLLSIIGLHLSFVVPLVVVNTCVAFSSLHWYEIFVAYTIGIVPSLFIYAYAGSHLHAFSSLSDILRKNSLLIWIIVGITTCSILYYGITLFIRYTRNSR